MADDKYTFEQARIRLEEIAAEVRKKDTSLEKSLDLLEEGVRLANICTELVDHTDTGASVTVEHTEGSADVEPEASAEALVADSGSEDVEATADTAQGAGAEASESESDPDGFDDADHAAEDAESVELGE